jgi:hypothetical protein
MYILTNENKSYELNHVPEKDVDLRYGVFDFSDKTNMDYYFLPLVFLESFYAPAIVLEIGPNKVQMPLDWSIVVCDESLSGMEVLPLTRLNDRGFHAMLFNPMKNSVPEVYEIEVTNIFAEVKWYFPKLKNNNLLVVPVEEGDMPKCLLFIKDVTKMADAIEIADLF